MSELSELINVAKNIESQNVEIIRLLKKIAGEDDSENITPLGMDFKLDKLTEEGYFRDDDPLGLKDEMRKFNESQQSQKDNEQESVECRLLDDVVCGVGEVLYIDGPDLFRLTSKNNESMIDNLTGSDDSTNFNFAEMIANESIKNNQSLDGSTVILLEEETQDLSESLRICYETGAKNVYIPWSKRSQLLYAPPMLMEIMKIDFFKNGDEIIEKLFG